MEMEMEMEMERNVSMMKQSELHHRLCFHQLLAMAHITTCPNAKQGLQTSYRKLETACLRPFVASCLGALVPWCPGSLVPPTWWRRPCVSLPRGQPRLCLLVPCPRTRTRKGEKKHVQERKQ